MIKVVQKGTTLISLRLPKEGAASKRWEEEWREEKRWKKEKGETTSKWKSESGTPKLILIKGIGTGDVKGPGSESGACSGPWPGPAGSATKARTAAGSVTVSRSIPIVRPPPRTRPWSVCYTGARLSCGH